MCVCVCVKLVFKHGIFRILGMDYVLEIAIALFLGEKNVHRRAIYAPVRKSESKNKTKWNEKIKNFSIKEVTKIMTSDEIEWWKWINVSNPNWSIENP